MTREKILEYAADGAHEAWVNAKQELDKFPDNAIAIHREAVRWTEYQEIEELLKAEYQKEGLA